MQSLKTMLNTHVFAYVVHNNYVVMYMLKTLVKSEYSFKNEI